MIGTMESVAGADAAEQLTSAVYLDQRPDIEHCLEVVSHLSGRP